MTDAPTKAERLAWARAKLVDALEERDNVEMDIRDAEAEIADIEAEPDDVGAGP